MEPKGHVGVAAHKKVLAVCLSYRYAAGSHRIRESVSPSSFSSSAWRFCNLAFAVFSALSAFVRLTRTLRVVASHRAVYFVALAQVVSLYTLIVFAATGLQICTLNTAVSAYLTL